MSVADVFGKVCLQPEGWAGLPNQYATSRNELFTTWFKKFPLVALECLRRPSAGNADSYTASAMPVGTGLAGEGHVKTPQAQKSQPEGWLV
ncbi:MULTISPECIES: hypothetical protein [Pseudomonas]|uniref:hypothetical protein n=1 Tax=Pseudomonas TaxID=286 RepID=UPI001269FC25|nr:MULTISPECIES: hypothetical protein [Pseudomonas]MBG8558819.1 hypothetical protein [Pseudomonas qingdaonensis]MDD1954139.1 hypothetical protein [Pseudomonas sp. 8209]